MLDLRRSQDMKRMQEKNTFEFLSFSNIQWLSELFTHPYCIILFSLSLNEYKY
jgi:hypothetical protein